MSPGATFASANLLSRRVGFCCRELQGVSTTLGELLWLYCESCEPSFEVTVMETKYLAAFWSLLYSCNWQTQRLILKMTTAQVVETSVTVNDNSPIQNYTPDDHTQLLMKWLLGSNLSQIDFSWKTFETFTAFPRFSHTTFKTSFTGSTKTRKSFTSLRSTAHLILRQEKLVFERFHIFALATKAFLNGNTDTAFWRKLYLMKALRNWVTLQCWPLLWYQCWILISHGRGKHSRDQKRMVTI